MRHNAALSGRRRQDQTVIRVLFICHGNICRSVAAQSVLAFLAEEGKEILVDSAATTNEEIGNPIYPPMRRALERAGIPPVSHAARKVTQQDYRESDYLICISDRPYSRIGIACKHKRIGISYQH